MSLPSTRNTNYSAGSPVKAVDLNDLQDCVIGAKHGEFWLQLVGGAATFENCKYSDSGGYVECTGAPWSAAIPVVALPGMRVKNARLLRQGNGASSMSVRLRKIEVVSGAPSVSTLKQVTVSSPSSTWTATDLGMTAENWVTTSRTLLVHLYVDGAGAAGTQRFAFPEILVDRP